MEVMKANTKNLMKSKWESENMMTAWKTDGRSPACFPSGKCLNSKNSRRTYRRMLKNKWRKEINRQFNEEISELWKQE
jgi:hypothetical protein